jgi:hypothetical protein
VKVIKSIQRRVRSSTVVIINHELLPETREKKPQSAHGMRSIRVLLYASIPSILRDANKKPSSIPSSQSQPLVNTQL